VCSSDLIVPVPLNPGDVLFIPIGWWHHVRALDVSMTLTHTNFRRRNDYYTTFPRD
jgi:ribosomal protein L16 Arg81 hydroxylase